MTLQNMDPYFPPCSDPSLALGCSQPAIYRINGVTPDSNGNIQINFVGFSSEISGNGFISLSVLANGTDNCSRPVMPDSSGRLPPYEQDTKPVTPYNLGPDSFIEVA